MKRKPGRSGWINRCAPDDRVAGDSVRRKAALPPLMDYWVPGMAVTGVHELVGNALILEGEKPRETNLRGEPLPGMEEEEDV